MSLATLLYLGSLEKSQKDVVIYTTVDQIYSEPILKDFENKSGIRVLAVYDVEATKTTGLVNRLIAEKGSPKADVFWNGEFAQTILLEEDGILAAYISPSAIDVPIKYKDPKGFWTGLGGRVRVILVNKNLLQSTEYPTSIFDLINPRFQGDQIGIAYPMFGTSATQVAALYAFLGQEKAREFYKRVYSRGVRVVDGNSVVKDLVAQGRLIWGLTDSDDACGALIEGAPVSIVIPDQHGEVNGTLLVPSTIALIANSPHPNEGRLLLDYLLGRDVESKLVQSGCFQTSVRPIGPSTAYLNTTQIKSLNISLPEIFAQLQPSQRDMNEIFIR